MQQIIELRDVLKEMQNGEPFDISFWAADKARNTGGRVVELKGVVQTSKNYKHAIRKVMLPSGEYRDLHIYLLRSFNNKRVCI